MLFRCAVQLSICSEHRAEITAWSARSAGLRKSGESQWRSRQCRRGELRSPLDFAKAPRRSAWPTGVDGSGRLSGVALGLERSDSRWYPTMRLFRRTTDGDWNTVVATIAEALQRLSSGA